LILSLCPFIERRREVWLYDPSATSSAEQGAPPKKDKD